MEHTDAEKLQAVEKYILGELPPSLREEFEAHYFDCAECSANLRTGVAFAAASRQYFAESAPQKVPVAVPQLGWFSWLKPLVVVPVFAALLLLIGYQNIFSIPRLKQTATSSVGAIGPWFSLVASDARGSAGPKFDVPPNHRFLLFIPITVQAHDPASRFLLRLEDSSGKILVSSMVSATEAKRPVPFSIPPLAREGEYKIVVFEQTATSTVQVSELPFAIAFSVQVEQHQ
jgi:putative zinc finger protein